MDSVVVIDLGSTKVVCLQASLQSNGDLRVDGVAQVGCRGMSKGIIADVDEVASSIDEAVSRVERATGSTCEDVVVSVSGSHVHSVNSQGFIPIYPSTRQIRRDDVMAVINHSRQTVLPTDREQIMAIPREFRVDGQRGVQHPIGMVGGRLEVVTHIITGLTSELNKVDKSVTRAGRKVEELVVRSLASGLGVASNEQLDLGCAVIDIGGHTTDVAVFQGGSIAHTACLPIGSHHVTTDLAALLKTSLDDAEGLKMEFGAALSRAAKESETVMVKQSDQTEARPMQRRVLCEIIESRMREISQIAHSQVEASGAISQLGAGVLITGGGSMMPAIGSLFGEVFGSISIQMSYPKVQGQHARTIGVPTMSTAVGLAKYCLEGDDQEFSPVSGFSNWKDKIRTLKNPFSKRV